MTSIKDDTLHRIVGHDVKERQPVPSTSDYLLISPGTSIIAVSLFALLAPPGANDVHR
jgi:hypothetical protein